MLQDEHVPLMVTGITQDRGLKLLQENPVSTVPLVVLHQNGNEIVLDDRCHKKDMAASYYNKLEEFFNITPLSAYEQKEHDRRERLHNK